jgi:hypothetical protein
MDRKIFRWEVGGAIFIIMMGTLLHFIYEWLGRWLPSSIVAAVNESPWEHLKLAFWPAFFFFILQFIFIGRKTPGFLAAKAASFYIMPAAILIIFYTYSGIIGGNLLVVDISSFIVAVLLGQYASYKIQLSGKKPLILGILAIVGIFLLLAVFPLFTFDPPHIPLFLDGPSGTYGIAP